MIEAVIFDLDGVIVSTDDYHYEAWKKLAMRLDIPFDKEKNNRLRGVSRMESLEIILEDSKTEYSEKEKIALATEKNETYKQLLNQISAEHILGGVSETLKGLQERSIKLAVGSSSKNAQRILALIGLTEVFDAIADGTMITKSKPDPEVFLLAAEKLGVAPENCLVIEDAESGVWAAKNGNMKVVGVGEASKMEGLDLSAESLNDLELLKKINEIM